RIAVAGESFGGYLTMCALTGYPDLWCAGSATVPFINWFTEMESERGDLRYWDLQNMGDPVRDRERLTEASPAFFIERIRAPVQIIAGANDPRCPLTESLQAKQKLEGTGVELDFKYYENEGHSFDRMENIVDSMLRTYRFLIAHLLR
ncbi:MAG: prolyl oligopeptidase family serine peptidase, partial [Candidatus Thermoplasmatota archaeon]|nr:prolyl oligopeptidase family serine peptidase [Candidatus Thermoplasmatota archaeon]